MMRACDDVGDVRNDNGICVDVVMIIGMVMIIENNFVCLDSDIQTNSTMY